MTKVTLETEWGTSDDIIVTKEINEDDLMVNDMLVLMVDVMKGFGYQEGNIYESFLWAVEEFKHWE